MNNFDLKGQVRDRGSWHVPSTLNLDTWIITQYYVYNYFIVNEHTNLHDGICIIKQYGTLACGIEYEFIYYLLNSMGANQHFKLVFYTLYFYFISLCLPINT